MITILRIISHIVTRSHSHPGLWLQLTMINDNDCMCHYFCYHVSCMPILTLLHICKRQQHYQIIVVIDIHNKCVKHNSHCTYVAIKLDFKLYATYIFHSASSATLGSLAVADDAECTSPFCMHMHFACISILNAHLPHLHFVHFAHHCTKCCAMMCGDRISRAMILLYNRNDRYTYFIRTHALLLQ